MRDMIVRALVAKGRDDRLMIIFPAGDADPGFLAGLRIAAVGGREDRREKLAPVFERDSDAMLAAFGRSHTRFPHQPQILAGLGAGHQRGPEVAILMHDAERLIVIGGRFEGQAARLEAVGDRDGADRAAFGGQTVGNANRPQHSHRGGGNGGGPAVEGNRGASAGIGRVDNDGGKPARIERGCQRQADQPAAKNDHVRPVHGLRV